MFKNESNLPEPAAKLNNLLMNWLLPIAAAISLIMIWIGVARGWERGPITNVIILVASFFVLRSFYHFFRRQFSK